MGFSSQVQPVELAFVQKTRENASEKLLHSTVLQFHQEIGEKHECWLKLVRSMTECSVGDFRGCNAEHCPGREMAANSPICHLQTLIHCIGKAGKKEAAK